jgi:hypothetical protein
VGQGGLAIEKANIDLGALRRLAASPEAWTWLAIAVNLFFRGVDYLYDRIPYIDEGLLLPNLRRPILDTGVLEGNQIAAPLFLIVERLMIRLPLSETYGGRLVPLIAGAASLFAMRDVARRCLSGWAVPAAVALFGMSDYILYYSSEMKPYSLDVLFTLLLTGGALRIGAGDGSRGALARLGVVGLVATWTSYTSCFVLAGVGTYLLAGALRRGDRRGAAAVAAWGLAWIASFAGVYALGKRMLTTDRFIWNWWDFAFLPLPPRSWGEAERVFWHLMNVYTNPVAVWTLAGYQASAFLGLGLGLIGAAALARSRPGALYLLAAPWLVTLAASGLHKYPFHGRLILFLVPSAWLLIAGGLAAIGRRASRAAAVLLFGFLILVPTWDAQNRIFPWREKIRVGDSHGDLRADLLDHFDARARVEQILREHAGGAAPRPDAAGGPGP